MKEKRTLLVIFMPVYIYIALLDEDLEYFSYLYRKLWRTKCF